MISFDRFSRFKALTAALLSVSFLAACGGGGGGGSDTPKTDTAEVNGISQAEAAAASATKATLVSLPSSREEAARFLTQASFGPSESDLNSLMTTGYQGWIEKQIALPQATLGHRAYWEQRSAAIKAVTPSGNASPNEVAHSFWRQAITGQDQLRQRVAFALSEIFVISTTDACVDQNSRGSADYLDMLGARAFGTYRDLLQAIAMHPVMGCYLSHIHNQKEDAATGRVPDENFAREIMQLFSIGLYQLNLDGSQKQAGGAPVLTYGPQDVAGLAKVFTGFSWQCPQQDDDGCFVRGESYNGNRTDPDRWVKPMVAYPRFHSKSVKQFLGVTIPAQSTADPAASLKVALDTLAKHPNVGPFIGKQLIQRLVTSNPSPAYVQRVATSFTVSGGNLATTIKAVLLDAEARDYRTAMNSNTFGKVREPILRMTALMRAYPAKSATGSFLFYPTDQAADSLSQSPLKSGSVFNFFRPGYTPPNSATAAQKLSSPEMQLMNETSVAGYINFVKNMMAFGQGMRGYNNNNETVAADVQMDFNVNSQNPTLALADNPTSLVEDINAKLMYGGMTASTKADINAAVASINYTDKAATRQRRIWIALLLAMSAPEFIVQR